MLVNRNNTELEIPEWQTQLIKKSIAEKAECPFENVDYKLPVDTLCPVCGFTGFLNKAYCIDDYR